MLYLGGESELVLLPDFDYSVVPCCTVSTFLHGFICPAFSVLVPLVCSFQLEDIDRLASSVKEFGRLWSTKIKDRYCEFGSHAFLHSEDIDLGSDLATSRFAKRSFNTA